MFVTLANANDAVDKTKQDDPTTPLDVDRHAHDEYLCERGRADIRYH